MALFSPSKSFYRKLGSCLLAFSALLVSLHGPMGRSAVADERVELTQKKAQVQIKIHQLQEKIKDQQDAISLSDSEENNVLRELEDIDQHLAQIQEKIATLELQVEKQENKTAFKEIELNLAREKNSSSQEHLEKRLRAYYMAGQVDFLNIAFSSQSLPELLSLQQGFKTLIEHDKQAILAFRKTIKSLENSRQALQLEEDALDAFLLQLASQKDSLAQVKKEKEELLVDIRNKKEIFTQALEEMQTASDDLITSLHKIKTQQDIANNIFLRAKGRHPLPAKGAILTTFKEKKENALGMITTSSGIVIDVAHGEPIHAIAEGYVMFAGYLRGYGNTVVIHHGYQYHTVTARIERITCKKGDKLMRGARIGISGDTATIIDEGILFEVRHGKEKLDPLQWVSR